MNVLHHIGRYGETNLMTDKIIRITKRKRQRQRQWEEEERKRKNRRQKRNDILNNQFRKRTMEQWMWCLVVRTNALYELCRMCVCNSQIISIWMKHCWCIIVNNNQHPVHFNRVCILCICRFYIAQYCTQSHSLNAMKMKTKSPIRYTKRVNHLSVSIEIKFVI